MVAPVHACPLQGNRTLLKRRFEAPTGAQPLYANKQGVRAARLHATAQRLKRIFVALEVVCLGGDASAAAKECFQLRPGQPAADEGDRVHIGVFVMSLGTISPVFSYVPYEVAAVLCAAHRRHKASLGQAVIDLPVFADVGPGPGGAAPGAGPGAGPGPNNLLPGDLTRQEMALIKVQAPWLHAVIALCMQRLQGFAMWAQPWELLWQQLYTLVHDTFQHIGGPPVCDVAPEQQLEQEASCQGLGCLKSGVVCGLPRLRQRPPYEADGSTDADAPAPEDGDCVHAMEGRLQRTGGVFTVFCPHGFCYGVFIIKDHESRNDLFTFVTSFFQRPPKFIVYDDSCHSEAYFLARWPEFIKHTKHVIDRFHFRNHTACSLAYCMNLFPELSHVNSQVVEQNNAALKRIAGALHSMKQETFMRAVRLYLHLWNVSKLAGIEAMQRSNAQRRRPAAS